jgi:ferredoxin--NADP+ reductase
MAIIKDPRTYDRFEKVILTHTVQFPEELAYKDVLESFNKEWDMITEGNFVYFNTLTKSPWEREGRITNWIKDSSLFKHTTKQDLDINLDRFMICGSEGLNKDLMNYFKGIGMKEGNTQIAGTYLVEKAFVE